MKIYIYVVLAAILIFQTGCGTVPHQDPVLLSANTLIASAGRVGVIMTPLPKVDTNFPGADCLLCYAAAAAMNSTLTDYVRTLPYEDLPKLKSDIAGLLRKKGANVVVIEEDLDIKILPDYKSSEPNRAYKDFSPLKKKFNIEKLLVINISSLGVWRSYASYVPTSDPKMVLNGAGYLVNVNNNTYEWYMPIAITKSADGQWDEPPQFPGLTNAYFQTLENGKDSLLMPFK